MINLALGICFAAPDDPEVFEALVNLVGRTQNIMVEAAMRMHAQPAKARIEALARAMLALTEPDPRATQTWAYTMRSLLAVVPETRRPRLRTICARATEHVLALA